jgi:hypothetical protein
MQVFRINRSASTLSEQALKYRDDPTHLGRLLDTKQEPQDPTIKNRVHGAKLIKWKVFIHCDKFIDFQKMVIFDILNQVSRLKDEQPTEEDLEKIELTRKAEEKQKKIIALV